MYGVSKDLDLSTFKGKTLAQLCIGEFQIQFRFNPDCEISSFGRWEVFDASGAVLDCTQEQSQRDVYRVHRLLGQTVRSWAIDPPNSFSLTFEDGLILRVYDDSDQYESFSIQPGNIFV